MSRHRQYLSLDYPIGWTALFRSLRAISLIPGSDHVVAPMEAGLFNFISKQVTPPLSSACLMLDHVTSLLPQQAYGRSQPISGPWVCYGISLYLHCLFIPVCHSLLRFPLGEEIGSFVSFHIPHMTNTNEEEFLQFTAKDTFPQS